MFFGVQSKALLVTFTKLTPLRFVTAYRFELQNTG